MGLLAGAVVLILCLHFGQVSGLTTGLQNSLTPECAVGVEENAKHCLIPGDLFLAGQEGLGGL